MNEPFGGALFGSFSVSQSHAEAGPLIVPVDSGDFYIPAHLECNDDLLGQEGFEGEFEVLSGRGWNAVRGSGQDLLAQIMLGSRKPRYRQGWINVPFKITAEGLWQRFPA